MDNTLANSRTNGSILLSSSTEIVLYLVVGRRKVHWLVSLAEGAMHDLYAIMILIVALCQ